jgi:DNA-dependent RNA polymerase auxiliary subunit epsilon
MQLLRAQSDLAIRYKAFQLSAPSKEQTFSVYTKIQSESDFPDNGDVWRGVRDNPYSFLDNPKERKCDATIDLF